MATLKDIYPYIKPYAAGCPEPAIDAEAVALAKQLAQRTNSLRDTAYFDSQAGWGMYDVTISAERSLEVVTKVCVNGVGVQPLTSKPCDACAEYGFWVDLNRTLYIYPAPNMDEAQGIEVEYSYTPRLASCEIDEVFLERYGYDISRGVLSRILMMKDQKWHNPTLAARYEIDWKTAMNSALIDGSTPFTRGHIRITQNAADYLDS